MFLLCRAQKLFWTDTARGTIESMNFDGSNRKTVLDREVPDVEGIAVEWVSKKLYWVDALVCVIRLSNEIV